LEELIARNCEIKAAVVAQDEREQYGRREALNFGHTVGHALESLLGYALRHGECVGLGMLAAVEICRQRDLLSADDAARVRLLIGAAGLPTQPPRAVPPDDVLARMAQDKKVRGGVRRFVLLDGIGRCFVADDVTDDEIRAGLAAIA
jgi:3-dehydroquinate synthase